MLVTILKCFRDKKIAQKSTLLWSQTSSRHTPVIVVSGFLGAGKTTLLNLILKSSCHKLRVAVIENELGSVSIDHSLLSRTTTFGSSDIYILKNGCICCSGQSGGTDILRILETLIDLNQQEENLKSTNSTQNGAFDCVVVELSGMADLSVIIQTFLKYQRPDSRFYLDGAITVVDAKHISRHVSPRGRLDAIAIEAEKQVAYADLILLNKCAPLDESTIQSALRVINSINSAAPVHKCDFHTWPDAVDVTSLFNLRAFSPDSVVTLFDSHPELFSSQPLLHAPSNIKSHSFDLAGFVDLDLFHEFIRQQLTREDRMLLRVKAILSVWDHPEEQYVFHGVHDSVSGVFELPKHDDDDTPISAQSQGRCRLVLIGSGLNGEELRIAFRSCFVDKNGKQKHGLGDLADIVAQVETEGNDTNVRGQSVW